MIGILGWNYQSGGRIFFWAIKQAIQTLRVTVELLNMHKIAKMEPVLCLQHIHDRKLNCLSCILKEHGLKIALKIECYTLKEGGLGFPCHHLIHLSPEAFPGSLSVCAQISLSHNWQASSMRYNRKICTPSTSALLFLSSLSYCNYQLLFWLLKLMEKRLHVGIVL